MKTTLFIALLGSVAFVARGSDDVNSPETTATPSVDSGETLAEAVIRINTKVQRDYGVLSPTPITESKLKNAIESAANEVAESEIPGRTAYVNTLTQIASTGHIPDSVSFHCMPITGSYSKKQKDESRDGRHLAISLNYVFLLPSDHGRRAIGLTQIVEVFQVIKPQEQSVPFQPPTQNPASKLRTDQ